MPVFHFHVSQPDSVRDLDGTELQDLMAARLEAVRLAGELIAEDPEYIATFETWSMEVTDHMGSLLFRLDFAIASSPAVENENKVTRLGHDAIRRGGRHTHD